MTAEHGAEALQKLRSFTRPPRVILLDLMMPVMNGWELLKELEKDVTLNKIPVVICSASTENLPTHIPLVKKPINHKTLLQIAKDYIKGA